MLNSFTNRSKPDREAVDSIISNAPRPSRDAVEKFFDLYKNGEPGTSIKLKFKPDGGTYDSFTIQRPTSSSTAPPADQSAGGPGTT